MSINLDDVAEKVKKHLSHICNQGRQPGEGPVKIVMFTDEGESVLDPREARRFYTSDGRLGATIDEIAERLTLAKNKLVPIKNVKKVWEAIRELAGRSNLFFRFKQIPRKIEPKYDFLDAVRTHNDKLAMVTKETKTMNRPINEAEGKDAEGRDLHLWQTGNTLTALPQTSGGSGMKRLDRADAEMMFGKEAVRTALSRPGEGQYGAMAVREEDYPAADALADLEAKDLFVPDAGSMAGKNPQFADEWMKAMFTLREWTGRVAVVDKVGSAQNYPAARAWAERVTGKLEDGGRAALQALSADESEFLAKFTARIKREKQLAVTADDNAITRIDNIFNQRQFVHAVFSPVRGVRFPIEIQPRLQAAGAFETVNKFINPTESAEWGDIILHDYVKALAAKLRADEELTAAEKAAGQHLLNKIKEHTNKHNVTFDNIFEARSLFEFSPLGMAARAAKAEFLPPETGGMSAAGMQFVDDEARIMHRITEIGDRIVDTQLRAYVAEVIGRLHEEDGEISPADFDIVRTVVEREEALDEQEAAEDVIADPTEELFGWIEEMADTDKLFAAPKTESRAQLPPRPATLEESFRRDYAKAVERAGGTPVAENADASGESEVLGVLPKDVFSMADQLEAVEVLFRNTADQIEALRYNPDKTVKMNNVFAQAAAVAGDSLTWLLNGFTGDRSNNEFPLMYNAMHKFEVFYGNFRRAAEACGLDPDVTGTAPEQRLDLQQVEPGAAEEMERELRSLSFQVASMRPAMHHIKIQVQAASGYTPPETGNVWDWINSPKVNEARKSARPINKRKPNNRRRKMTESKHWSQEDAAPEAPAADKPAREQSLRELMDVVEQSSAEAPVNEAEQEVSEWFDSERGMGVDADTLISDLTGADDAMPDSDSVHWSQSMSPDVQSIIDNEGGLDISDQEEIPLPMDSDENPEISDWGRELDRDPYADPAELELPESVERTDENAELAEESVEEMIRRAYEEVMAEETAAADDSAEPAVDEGAAEPAAAGEPVVTDVPVTETKRPRRDADQKLVEGELDKMYRQPRRPKRRQPLHENAHAGRKPLRERYDGSMAKRPSVQREKREQEFKAQPELQQDLDRMLKIAGIGG